MASVKSRLEALESQISEPDAKEAAWEKQERERIARQEAEDDRFLDCLDLVADGLEDEFAEKVLLELLAATWEQIDLRGCGEFGKANGLSLLSNAVLSLAVARYNGRKIPNALPRPLCEFFDRNPANFFERREWAESEKVGNYWLNSPPHWSWLAGCVSCEACALPLPAIEVMGIYKVERLRDEPGPSEVLPFKQCPACGGQVAWSVCRK